MTRPLALLSFLSLLVVSSFGQVSPGWRLAKTTYYHPDGILMTEYKYDSKGNISGVLYKEGKKLIYTETNFKTNQQAELISFTRNYANNLTPRATFSFEYAEDGKLKKLNQTIYKDGKEKFNLSKEYKWSAQTIEVTELRTSFAGILTSISKYSLDSKKNILKIEYLDKNGTQTASSFIFKEYDSAVNPFLLFGNYITGDISSANNKLDEKLEGGNPAKISYSYNKDGFPTEQKTTYTFADSGPVTHRQLYQYLKVVTPSTKATKTALLVPKPVREKAIGEEISSISVCIYKSDTVYLLSKRKVGPNRSVLNIEDRYYAGNGALVKMNNYSQAFYLPRKDSQLIPELSVVKL